MTANEKNIPDNTAVRVALWRALHVEADARPHVLEDAVGLQLVAPDDDWRKRPDMDLEFLKQARASIVTRARFVEDLVEREMTKGVEQYVILGAGLDTFAQRRPDVASKLQIFEIDRPDTQNWKRRRLVELGFGVPEWLHFVPVDFESGASWPDELVEAGFDQNAPAVVACLGVSMYLTREAILSTLRAVTSFAPGTILAMTFLLPIELIDAEARPLQEMATKGAARSGTPFISLFSPDDMLALAREAGFKNPGIVSNIGLSASYLANRTDGLTISNAEQFLLAHSG